MSEKNIYPQLNQQPPHGAQQPPPHYGQHPPPQGYPGAPPPQGYHGAPPPQSYPGAPPPQGYPGYAPPPGSAPAPYAPQPYQTAPAPGPGQTVIVHQTVRHQPVQQGPSQASKTFGNLLSGASKLSKSISSSVQKEIDIHASSPTLSMFATGAILQFINRSNNMCLRTLPNGALDCLGNPAMNDPYTHYKVQNHGNNVVTMNCMGNPTFFVTVDKAGGVYGNGPGGFESKLRLHETFKGFITFESLQFPNSHLATMPNGMMKPAKMAKKDQDSQFSIRLIAPAQGYAVQVQQTSTVVYK